MAERHYRPLDRDRAPAPYLSAADEDDRHRLFRHGEDRIASNEREIQTLLQDNQRLAAAHVALKQELSASNLDIRHLSSAAAQVKADKDAEVRDVYERSLKMEAEVRRIDAIGPELEQVRADVQTLRDSNLELATKVKEVEADLVKARAEVQRFPAVEAEIDAMRLHIQKGRAAIDYEKKVHVINHEQSLAMEKDKITLAQEIEKLRAELANAEKRARATAAAAANPSPGYASGYAGPGYAAGPEYAAGHAGPGYVAHHADPAYAAGPANPGYLAGHADPGFAARYADPGYTTGPANPASVYGANSYPYQYSVHQVQNSVEPGPQYGVATLGPPRGSYDIHQTHAQQQ